MRTYAGPTLLLVEETTPGVAVTTFSLVGSCNAVDVKFSSVKVASSALIGKAGEATRVIGRGLDIGRALLAAEPLGMVQEAFDRNIAWAGSAKKLGMLLPSHDSGHIAIRWEAGRFELI